MKPFNSSQEDFDDITLVDVIKMGIRDSLVQMYVSLPATVVSYDTETQTIGARISITQVIGDSYIEYPVLKDIPLLLPRNKKSGMSYIIVPGDQVQLIFNQRSTNNWRAKGPGYAPDSAKMFDINDAYALPTINPVEVPYNQRQGTELLGEKIFIGNPEESITLSDQSTIECDLIQILSTLLLDLQKPLVSSMGPVTFDPMVDKNIKAIKLVLDKLILEE